MNAEPKLLSLRQKIEDSECQVFLHSGDKKKDHFDLSDIRKFAPKLFDSFAFAPSSGASGAFWLSSLQGFLSELWRKLICSLCLLISVRGILLKPGP